MLEKLLWGQYQRLLLSLAETEISRVGTDRKLGPASLVHKQVWSRSNAGMLIGPTLGPRSPFFGSDPEPLELE